MEQLEVLLKDKDKQINGLKTELADSICQVEKLQDENHTLKQHISNLKNDETLEILKKEGDVKDKMINKLKQEVEILEANTKNKQVIQTRKEAELRLEVILMLMENNECTNLGREPE